jgi:hypothetical protein
VTSPLHRRSSSSMSATPPRHRPSSTPLCGRSPEPRSTSSGRRCAVRERLYHQPSNVGGRLRPHGRDNCARDTNAGRLRLPRPSIRSPLPLVTCSGRTLPEICGLSVSLDLRGF